MSIFGSIGKAVKGVAKGVTKVAGSAVNVVAKPVAKVLKPVAGPLGKLAAKATAGTPLGGAVGKITKLDFTKDPVKAIGSAYVQNLKGSAELGKSLIAAKIGGAVSSAVGSTIAKSPLGGTQIGESIGTTITGAVKEGTNSLLGATTPGKSRGGSVYKTASSNVNVKGDGAKLGVSLSSMAGNLLRSPIGTAIKGSWGDWSGRKETLGGLVDDGVDYK